MGPRGGSGGGGGGRGNRWHLAARSRCSPHTPLQVGAAVRRPGLWPGLRFPSSSIRPTHAQELRLAGLPSVGLGCQTGVRNPGAASRWLLAGKWLV